MAGYAALTSLMHIVKQLQEYGRDLITLDKAQTESLGQKVGSLQDFLETYSNIASKEAELLDNQIADSAYAAEDIIESHVVNRIRAGSHRFMRSSSAVFCNLDEVIDNLDTIMKRVKDINTKDSQRFKAQIPEYSIPTRSTPTGKITMVGLDEEQLRVMDWLTGGNDARQAISIVGMGGIGKTTLARSVLEKPLIVKHFDIHIWATVSQQYSRHKILSEMVLCLNGKEGGNFSGNDEDQLGEILYKSLSGRRYLVVMDDVWNIEAWDMVRFFLPDNGNGSRVVVTTRESKMASHFGRCCLKMEFLDEDQSWDLFCQETFGHDETCPSELEEDGRAIVEKCKGLPLSIVVIAGLLKNSSRTREYWKSTSENLSPSTLNSEDGDHCMKILSSSYNYLPLHLKPCFLYMALFPEDHEIHVSQLVKLWAAEGFLKLNGPKSSEDVAEGYLLDLVDRNLVLVGRRRHNGCIKTCRIHDLLRDLCVRIAPQGRFLCLLSTSGNDIPHDADKERRIVVHKPKPLNNSEWEDSIVESPRAQTFGGLQAFFSFFCAPFRAIFSLCTTASLGNHFKLLLVLKSASLCRSLMCGFEEGHHRLPSSRLLRVCNTNVGMFSPKAHVFNLFNLRYLSFKPNWFSGSVDRLSFPPSNPGTAIPSTISLLWNVQTMIFRGVKQRFILPSEFWSMSQLRHIEFDEVSLPDQAEGHDDLILENLETLSNVVKFRCNEEMVKRIPNVKKLKITYYNVPTYNKAQLINSLAGSYDSLEYLDRLGKLESLNLIFHGSPQQSDSLHMIAFPRSLKKLTLLGTRLEWADMTTIGSLPNLEVLVLEAYSVAGSEWNLAEEGFPCLKVLRIYDSELEHLNADETHFPSLESFVFEHLEILAEIPLSIGYITTLMSIDLFLCSDSAVASSKKLLEEQEGNGNEDIQVRVTFHGSEELENFMAEMELESLASDNFRVTVLPSYDEL